MAVRDGLGQHVRPGAGELERLRRQLLRELVVGGQVEDAIADFVRDDACGGGAEAHSLVGPERFDVADRVAGLDARHAGHEVVDHAVGLGVAGVETVQLSIGDKVDPGKFLRLENNGKWRRGALCGTSRRTASGEWGSFPRPWFESSCVDHTKPSSSGRRVGRTTLSLYTQPLGTSRHRSNHGMSVTIAKPTYPSHNGRRGEDHEGVEVLDCHGSLDGGRGDCRPAGVPAASGCCPQGDLLRRYYLYHTLGEQPSI